MTIAKAQPDSFFGYLKAELEKNVVDHVMRVEPQGGEVFQLTVISKGGDIAAAPKFFIKGNKIATKKQFLF
jgi:hypothetical protein